MELFGQVPETAEVITGGGGRHFFFRYSGGAVPKTLAIGVDLKGDGGYVVAPPSIHSSGKRYQVDGIAGARAFLRLAEAPCWLLERIASGTTRREESVGDATKWGAGARNNKLASRAGTMRRCGFSRETIEAALLEENRRRCDPPLADDEVRRIAESVARYKPAHESAGQNAPLETFKLVHLGDLLDEPEELKNWVLEGVIAGRWAFVACRKTEGGKVDLGQMFGTGGFTRTGVLRQAHRAGSSSVSRVGRKAKRGPKAFQGTGSDRKGTYLHPC